MKEIRHLKTIKNKKKFEHKMASPAKRPKCRYDFVAFTFMLGITDKLIQDLNFLTLHVHCCYSSI